MSAGAPRAQAVPGKRVGDAGGGGHLPAGIKPRAMKRGSPRDEYQDVVALPSEALDELVGDDDRMLPEQGEVLLDRSSRGDPVGREDQGLFGVECRHLGVRAPPSLRRAEDERARAK